MKAISGTTGAKPNRVLLVVRKEWLDLSRQRSLLVSTLVPPIIFAILPIVVFYFTGVATTTIAEVEKGAPPLAARLGPTFAGMSDREVTQALAGQEFSLLMLLLPAILPSIISSYSVVGEKTERTLEPVLATPIHTWEFLMGKCLTALVPSVLITWLLGIIFVIGVYALAISQRVIEATISPGWVIALLLATPLLALISIAATVAVSSRANDPRTAQQISVFMIIPVMALFFGQLSGVLLLSPLVALVGSLLLAVVAFIAVVIMVQLFRRETILTRWS